ncbi:MAG: DUF3078 domain-containing protein [Bacteroidetes bacterium]|nr:DUF3078 domain-containing protein [Bacteroidota bacterium]
MKKLLLSLTLIIITAGAFAQQDTVWRRGGLIAINFTQVSLTNWAAGGQNSISGNGIINYFANYKRGKNVWDNNLDLGYGMLIQGSDKARKSDDKIDFSSKYGREAFSHWYYSALFNFRSQFTPGYNYPNDSTVISNFLAPAYITFALGMDYKPNPHFSLFISPAAVRWTIVNDKDLSNAGAFGVDSGEVVETEAGALLKASLNVDLAKNINLSSTVDLFSNYLKDPQNIDVNWQLLLSVKISKYFSASLSTQLIYDDNTTLTFYKSDNTTVDHTGPGVQFKEVLGIGFSYKFAGVSVK